MTQILPVPIIYLNVKAYGAKGDGSTDDTTAIANALTAGQSTGAPVYFPPSSGAYITTQITAYAGMTLLGGNDGNFGGSVPTANRSIIKLKAASNTQLIDGPTGASNVRIKDLELDGNSANQTGGSTLGLIHLDDDGGVGGDEAQWCIERCYIHNGYGHNIYLGKARRGNTLYNNDIMNAANGDGILIAGSDNTIIGGYIGDNARNGIGVGSTNTTHYTSSGNAAAVTIISHVGIFKNGQVSAGAGIAVAQSSSSTSIIGCGMDRNQYEAVTVYDGSTTKISGVNFHSNYASANNTGGHIALASGVTKIAIEGNSFGPQDSDVTNLVSYAVVPASNTTIIHGNIGVQDSTDSVSGLIPTSANWVGQPLANIPTALYGYLGWTFDPAAVNGSAALSTAGTITLCKIPWPVTRTVTNIVVVVGAGGTLTTGNYAGIYNSSGTLLGATADQTSVWNSAGTAPKTMAISGGAISVPGGGETGFIYVALLWNGSVSPQFYKGTDATSAIFNGSLSAATLRNGINSTGNSTLPTPLTLSSSTASSNLFWAAVS